jgi:hypothetical protein
LFGATGAGCPLAGSRRRTFEGRADRPALLEDFSMIRLRFCLAIAVLYAVPCYHAAAQSHGAGEQNRDKAEAGRTANATGLKSFTGDGAAQDDQKAVYWFRYGANLGDEAAQFNLGWMYEHGRGVAQDYGEAVRWYHLAAQTGYAGAQSRLGNMYRKGLGTPQDDAACRGVVPQGGRAGKLVGAVQSRLDV